MHRKRISWIQRLYNPEKQCGAKQWGSNVCVQTKDGGAWCFGENDHGELGAGYASPDSAWIKVSNGVDINSFALSGWHSCALDKSKQVYCWGNNLWSALAVDQNVIKQSITPILNSTLPPTKQLVAGGSDTCALLLDDKVRCWGYHYAGNTIASAPLTLPNQLINIDDVQSIAEGSQNACAIKKDGSSWCWGDNSSHQIDDYLGYYQEPNKMNSFKNAKSIAIGDKFICALLSDGTVKCVGERPAMNWNYALGADLFPKQEKATSIVAGASHACALLESGKVICWGEHLDGQHGRRINIGNELPSYVVGLVGVKQIAASGDLTCALYKDDAIACWGLGGSNTFGKYKAPFRPVTLE